jgi:hypothetical protein
MVLDVSLWDSSEPLAVEYTSLGFGGLGWAGQSGNFEPSLASNHIGRLQSSAQD